MERLFDRLAVGCAAAGLALLLGVMASGRAWPDPVFAIGAPAGLGLLVLCLVFLAGRWAVRFAAAVRGRRLARAAALAVAALICLAGFFLRR